MKGVKGWIGIYELCILKKYCNFAELNVRFQKIQGGSLRVKKKNNPNNYIIQLSGKNAQNPQQKYQTASNLVKIYYKSLTWGSFWVWFPSLNNTFWGDLDWDRSMPGYPGYDLPKASRTLGGKGQSTSGWPVTIHTKHLGWKVQHGFDGNGSPDWLVDWSTTIWKTISDGKFPEILQPPPPVCPKKRENYKRCWISLFAKRHFEGQVHLTIVSQLMPGKGVIFGKVPFLVKFTSSFLNNCFTKHHGSIHAFFSSLVSPDLRWFWELSNWPWLDAKTTHPIISGLLPPSKVP